MHNCGLVNHLANLLKVEIGGRPNAVEFIDDDVFCIAGEVHIKFSISRLSIDSLQKKCDIVTLDLGKIITTSDNCHMVTTSV